MQFGFPLLSLLTFLPVIGMIITAFLPKSNVKLIRFVSVGVTALMMIMSVVLWMNFDAGMAGINDPKSFQFVERFDWIRITGLGVFGNIAIDYYMGVDGLSVTMVLLTSL
ncbi:MAG TPA: NADH-quinone oxidoreductase subunit M, partial [Candidatus Kapabacteria bacterium]